jgi:hypothetical protein
MTPQRLRQAADWFETYHRMANVVILFATDMPPAAKAEIQAIRQSGIEDELRLLAEEREQS